MYLFQFSTCFGHPCTHHQEKTTVSVQHWCLSLYMDGVWTPPIQIIENMLCRMRKSLILQSMQHTQGDTKERELLKCVVAVKDCIRGGGRHLQDVIFKH